MPKLGLLIRPVTWILRSSRSDRRRRLRCALYTRSGRGPVGRSEEAKGEILNNAGSCLLCSSSCVFCVLHEPRLVRYLSLVSFVSLVKSGRRVLPCHHVLKPWSGSSALRASCFVLPHTGVLHDEAKRSRLRLLLHLLLQPWLVATRYK